MPFRILTLRASHSTLANKPNLLSKARPLSWAIWLYILLCDFTENIRAINPNDCKTVSSFIVGLTICAAIPWSSHQSRAPKYNESDLRPWPRGTLLWCVVRSVRSRTETTIMQPSTSSPFDPLGTFVAYFGSFKRRGMHTIILPFPSSGISVLSVPMLNEWMPWRVLLLICFTHQSHR